MKLSDVESVNIFDNNKTISHKSFEKFYAKEMAKKSSEKMKITDLNIDCLESVFEYLDLQDLLNVADANKYLNIVAKCVFRRKHSNKMVHIPVVRIARDRRLKFDINSFGFIQMSDLRTILAFLRCFGCFVSHVTFKFSLNIQISNNFARNYFECNQHVMLYINEYCSGTLKDIVIKNGPKDWDRNMKKPFSMLQGVELFECGRVDAESISNIFPQMVRFNIVNTDFRKRKSNSMESVTKLKSVKHLSVSGANSLKLPFSFGKLRTLTVGHSVALDKHFFRMIHENPKITNLDIRTDTLSEVDQLNIAESLRFLDTLYVQCTLTDDEALRFVASFGNLKYFQFKLSQQIDFEDLQAHLNSEWLPYMFQHGFIFMKKQRLPQAKRQCLDNY